MKKLKVLLAAATLSASGMAFAEMIDPFYNPASVYNPSTGQYEDGCGAGVFYSYSWNSAFSFGPMLSGQSTQVLNTYIYCSGGTLYASGEAYTGYLRN
ncbi:MAG: hypothetical protein ABIT83_19775 [Massilia sp.]